MSVGAVEACPVQPIYYLPTCLVILAASLPVLGVRLPSPAPLALLAAEMHFSICRVHGDCRGGKPAPTLFALMLHTVAFFSGTEAAVTLSLHRLLVCWTYFLTGLRKMYCVGPRWCDGKNLQLMLSIQGLYHDDRESWNSMIAQHRLLCRFGSVAVVVLQLSLPLVLMVDHPWARPLAFAAAMGFHSSNHVLWRINFFVAWCPSLLALLAPGDQLHASALWQATASRSAVGPTVIVAFYLVLQLGHALDLATERLLLACKRRVKAAAPRVVRSLCLRLLWLLNMHCLGDYYSR